MPNQYETLMMRKCRHPKCTTPVRASLQIHLCPEHRHARGLCFCSDCRMRDKTERILTEQARKAATRPGTYQFHPPTYAPGDGHSHMVKPVTLPGPDFRAQP